MKKNALFFLGLSISIFFAGCAKDPENPGYARYMYLNAIHDVVNTDFYADNFKQNITPIAFGSNTIYNGITPGDRLIAIKLGLVNSTITQKVFNIKLNEANRPNYTLIASNSTASPDLIWIEDDLTLPAAGKSGLRIINASPDAPSLNAYVGTALVPIFPAASYAYKSFSAFTPIDATVTGTSYSIQIRNVSNGAVLRTQTMTATAGKLYTIVVRGLVTPSFAFPGYVLSSTLVGNN